MVNKTELFNTVIRLIGSTNSYIEYKNLVNTKSYDKDQLGFIQEIFAKFYFEVHTVEHNVKQYISYEWKPDHKLIESLGMPPKDIGTDGIIIHNDGKVSLVQVKWRSNPNSAHNRSDYGNICNDYLNLDEHTRKFIYFFTSIDNVSTKVPKKVVKQITASEQMNIEWGFFKQNVSQYLIDNKLTKLVIVKDTKRPWQKEAHKFCKNKEKMTVCAICGAGKTLFSYFEIKPETHNLIVVPSLQLLSQWFATLSKRMNKAKFLLVGSDLDTEHEYDVIYELTTDEEVIADHILNTDDTFICISTYQSLNLVHDTLTKYGCTVDNVFADEAHLTATHTDSNFNLVTRDDFPCDKKYFLTATPKVFSGVKQEKVTSMDDESVYGPQFHYSCRTAIEDDILCDYNIILGMCEGVEEGYPTSQRHYLYSKFLAKAVKEYGLTKILITSTSHKTSQEFFTEFKKHYSEHDHLVLMPKCAKPRHKSNALEKIETGPCIIFNVRVFNLGTDIRPLEAVFFNGDRKSVIDIVQTSMRCTRSHVGKELAYILVPAFTGSDLDVEEGDYPNVRNMLLALGNNDSAIMEECVLRSTNAMMGGDTKPNRIHDVSVSDNDFEIGDVSLRLFDRLGNSGGVSHLVRFARYKEVMDGNTELLPAKYVDKETGLKLGIFQDTMLGCFNGRNGGYKAEKNSWLKDIKTWPCWPEFEKRIELSKENQVKKKWTLDEKFARYKEVMDGRVELLPQSFVDKETGLKLGSFQNDLIGSFSGRNKQYKNKKDDWLKEIKTWPCWTEFEKRIKASKENQGKKKWTLDEKFARYKEVMDGKSKLLPKSFVDKETGLKLGSFQAGILGCFSGRTNELQNQTG